jgi:hypothetical protein
MIVGPATFVGQAAAVKIKEPNKEPMTTDARPHPAPVSRSYWSWTAH